jgi:hypothetical protein
MQITQHQDAGDFCFAFLSRPAASDSFGTAYLSVLRGDMYRRFQQLTHLVAFFRLSLLAIAQMQNEGARVVYVGDFDPVLGLRQVVFGGLCLGAGPQHQTHT